MDSVTGLLATSGVLLTVLLIAFLIALVAMPFLVWGIHSAVKDIRFNLISIEMDVSAIEGTLDSIQLDLDNIAGHEVSKDTLDAFKERARLRSQVTALRAKMIQAQLGSQQRKPTPQSTR